MKTAIALAVWLLATLGGPGTAYSQPVHVEADVTSGYSTDHVLAAATQVRLFGDVLSGLRVYVEGAWAARKLLEEEEEAEEEEEEYDTDAFGAAYPYANRVQVSEIYGERLFRPGRALVGFRAGRYRTPFGIHDRSDYAYSGFLRAPLIRYDGYWALSNNFLEHGAELIVGVPQLYLTTSVGAPADVGSVQRRSGVDSVSRLQAYHGPWIVGASLIRTNPYSPATFARGRSVFTGLDARFSRGGVQVLAEWLTGRPFDGTSTDGWHVSVIVHRHEMGRVSAVFRLEALDYEADPPHARGAQRQTAGARVLLSRNLSAQINVLHQTGNLSEYATALDVAVTYSIRLR
jgi:hypothetical protein